MKLFEKYIKLDFPTISYLEFFFIVKMYIFMMMITLYIVKEVVLDQELVLSLMRTTIRITSIELIGYLCIVLFPMLYNLIVYLKHRSDRKGVA